MMKDKLVTFCYEGVSVLAMASIILAVVFAFGIRFVGVVGSSMNPTLASGDWVIVSQFDFDYEPSYGDVVVISQPNSLDENIIKRVIATEGQTIDIDFTTGDVYLEYTDAQGVTHSGIINETYINNPTTNYYDMTFPITIPEGYCFVMGDNRQNSVDSRSSVIGLIDERYILGTAIYGITDNGFESLDLRGSM